MNVEILDPKAKKLLMDLADMKLISIKEATKNPFMAAVKRIRAKKANLSMEEITKEVELVRSKRYAKKD